MSSTTHDAGPHDDQALPPLAVVTGASSGIGRALVAQFVDGGFEVVAAAEDERIHELESEYDGVVRAVRVDLATAAGVVALYDAARAGGRTVDAAAINAGVAVGGRFDETNLDADLNLIDLNVRSTVHLAKLLARDMVAAGRGRLLFTASIAAVSPTPYQATYAASKAFVHSFAEAIRVDLDGTGVSVTSLMPGPTDTEIFERGDLADTGIATGHLDAPEEVAADGFAAMMAGKPHVVSGALRNRVLAEAATHIPDRLLSRVTATQTKPGTGKAKDDDQD